MDTFFHEQIQEHEDVILNVEESFHLSVVLRKKMGDIVELIDGKGNRSISKIVVSDKKRSILQTSKVNFYPETHFHTIAIAPTKNIDRFEYFLEKSVEIGVQSIIPMLTKNAERKLLNAERMEKIILSAAKQSKSNYLPRLFPLEKFANVILREGYEQKLIATCDGETIPLKQAYQPMKNSLIFVGPEGDFSAEEIQLAIANRAIPISLGQQRLRVETAGVFVCSSIVLLNQT